MKLFLYFLMFLSFSSFSCKEMEKTSTSPQPLTPPQNTAQIKYPNKELKELIISGSFFPNQPIKNQGSFFLATSSNTQYCFNEEKNREGELLPDKSVRARLYDKNGKMLAESLLRFLDGITVSVIIYLPYHKEAFEIRIVRLKEGKEIVIETLSDIKNLAFLKRNVKPEGVRKRIGGDVRWVYAENMQCFFFWNHYM